MHARKTHTVRAGVTGVVVVFGGGVARGAKVKLFFFVLVRNMDACDVFIVLLLLSRVRRTS